MGFAMEEVMLTDYLGVNILPKNRPYEERKNNPEVNELWYST